MSGTSSSPVLSIPPRLDTPGLRQILDIVVRTARPERVVLFGSRARGDFRPDSDYDIAVFKRGLGNERILTGHIYRSLFKDGPMASVDLLAFDPDREEAAGKAKSIVRAAIDSEGIVIYG